MQDKLKVLIVCPLLLSLDVELIYSLEEYMFPLNYARYKAVTLKSGIHFNITDTAKALQVFESCV